MLIHGWPDFVRICATKFPQFFHAQAAPAGGPPPTGQGQGSQGAAAAAVTQAGSGSQSGASTVPSASG